MLRADGRDHAVDVRDANAHGDQREHVRAAIDDRRPAALEERPAAPEHDRSGQHEFDPRQPVRGQDAHARACRRIMPPIAMTSSGAVSDDADPEAPRHVAKFGILFFVRGDGARLQRHAADGTTTRLGANDFRMHGAGVFNFGCRERALGLERHAATWTGAGWVSRTSGHMGQT